MVNDARVAPSLTIEAFLKDLSNVSYRYGLAIGELGEVYLMECDDYESRYYLTEGDFLRFVT